MCLEQQDKRRVTAMMCTNDDAIVTVVTISWSASVFLMAPSLVLNQLFGEETSTNENV
jgi:hypothetical protein